MIVLQKLNCGWGEFREMRIGGGIKAGAENEQVERDRDEGKRLPERITA